MPTVTFFLIFLAICILLLLFWIHRCTRYTWLHVQRFSNSTQNSSGEQIFVISHQLKKYDPNKDLPPTYSEVIANPSKYKEAT